MILTKTCSKCKVEQPIANFSKNKCIKDGYCNWCKECTKESHRKIYIQNRDKILAKHKEYRENNKEKIKKLCADWYIRNRDEVKEKHRIYHRTHREERLAYSKKYNARPEVKEHRAEYVKNNRERIRMVQQRWRDSNREEYRRRHREYYHNNKDKNKQWHKKWRDSHKEQIKDFRKRYREENKEKINQYHLNRLHNDPVYKMKEQTRNMVRYVFRERGHRKESRTADILGCDLDFFCDYMFKTWEKNYGKPWNGEPYHIDHIVPLATAKTEEDIIRLCHYTNLQMLTPEDNMDKSDKI